MKEEEKFEKLSRKYYKGLKKNWSVLNICWNSGKSLGQFWENFGYILEIFNNSLKILDKWGIKLR